MTTHHTELPESWRLAILAMHKAPRVLLYGLPGTGKSYAATITREHPAGTVERDDVLSLTLHEDASASDIIGGYLPKQGKWDWRDGPAVQAWRTSHERPVRLVLNEIDQAAGPVLTALYAILDDPESAVLTLPTGETLRPNPANLQIVSTMNGQPCDLPEALYDRHDAESRLDAPHPDSLAKLPAEWREIAAGLTSATARTEGRGTTPRDWHSLDRLTRRGVSFEDAATMVGWSAERMGEIRDHMMIASAPAADDIEDGADAKTDDDEDLDAARERHAERVADGLEREYECENGCGPYDSEIDDDGDAYCPNCESYENANEARDRWIRDNA